MSQTQDSSTVVGPVVALGLAAGAAVSFAASDAIGSLDPDAEELWTLTGLLGLAFLCWATLVCAASAVPLLRGALTRQPVSRAGAALLGAAVAVIAVVVWTHPLWGSGSGYGG